MQQQLDTYNTITIEAISRRAQKALRESAYADALEGSFSEAMGAINHRKAYIQNHRETVEIPFSEETVKGELDFEKKTFFTISPLFSTSFEFQGNEFQVTQVKHNNVDQSYTYSFRRV